MRTLTILLLSFVLLVPFNARAQTSVAQQPSSVELQSKINSRAIDISNLEKTIKQYEAEISSLSTREITLAKTLQALSLTQKKLEADISLTQKKILTKNSDLSFLSQEIGKAVGDIEDSKLYISEALRNMNKLSGDSLPSVILSGESLSASWNSVSKLAKLEGDTLSRIKNLTTTKKGLETDRKATEKAKAELVRLQAQYNDEKKILLQTTKEQKDLLNQTKNSEAAFAKLLTEKKALKDEFEREILTFESQLKLSVDISKLPQTGTGILSWPLDKVSITQYFGNTAFATANAGLYSGNGHNGIDLQASIGTPIKAALSGNIAGVGNTDLVYGCYSLGKWILVKHVNGLSTLYAHLSLPIVAAGASVVTGQVIGYSGNTGYTTGPHLHFGVYASSGIEIKRFVNSRSCGGATLPVATLQAYLNPLSYLPMR